MKNWSPYECGSNNSCVVPIGPVYNGLVEYNPETDEVTDIRGDLAKDWKLGADGVTYTFNLHENALWADGEPVTAEDVVFSLDSMVSPDEPRAVVGALKPFYDPGSSRALDDHTVELVTKFPTPVFLLNLALDPMKMLPKHWVETGVDMKLAENVNGSGPFKLVKHDKDIVIEYVRNVDYFKERFPYFEGLRHFIIVDPGTAFAAFRAQQILTHTHPTNTLTALQNKQLAEDMEGKGAIFPAGPTGSIWAYLNTQRAPFDDPRVRRALHLATHRQPFIQTFSGGLDKLGGPYPPDKWFSLSEDELARLPGFRETADGKKHPDDLAEAKRLLAEAGVASDFKTSILGPRLAELVNTAVLWSDQMRTNLGIDIEVLPVDVATFVERLIGVDFELGSGGYALRVMDPHDFLGGAYTKGEGLPNVSGWNNPRVDEIFQLQARELDRGKRKVLVSEAEELLLGDQPYVNWYWSHRVMYVDNRIKNFHTPGSQWENFKAEHLWCDPDC